MGSLWRRVYPDKADALEAELENTRDKIVAARDQGDDTAEAAVIQEWEGRLGRLLDDFPDLATELRRLLDEELTSATPGPPAGEPSSDIRQDVHVKGNARVYQTTGPQYHFEVHPGGSSPDDDKGHLGKKPGKPHRIIAAFVAAVIVLIVIVLIVRFAGSNDNPAHAATSATKPPSTTKPPSSVSTEKGLLNASDLGGLYFNLQQSTFTLPASSLWNSSTCGRGNAHPTSAHAREFREGTHLFLVEIIEAFPSRDAARQAYETVSSAMACKYSPLKNISSTVSGLGDDGYALATHFSSKSAGLTEAACVGTVLFGRYVLILAAETPLDNSLDQASTTFSQYSYVAAHKILTLHDAS